MSATLSMTAAVAADRKVKMTDRSLAILQHAYLPPCMTIDLEHPLEIRPSAQEQFAAALAQATASEAVGARGNVAQVSEVSDQVTALTPRSEASHDMERGIDGAGVGGYSYSAGNASAPLISPRGHSLDRAASAGWTDVLKSPT